MPHLSGLELLARLPPTGGRPSSSSPPTASSASTPSSSRRSTICLKPFTAERLEEALARALRRCDDRDLARRNAELQRRLEAVQADARAGGGGAGASRELWVAGLDGERRLKRGGDRMGGAERDYVRIHTAERNYLHRTPLKELLATPGSGGLPAGAPLGLRARGGGGAGPAATLRASSGSRPRRAGRSGWAAAMRAPCASGCSGAVGPRARPRAQSARRTRGLRRGRGRTSRTVPLAK